jgi:hypothetical protein
MDAGKTRNCPQCGNEVAETDQFCSKCFARLEPPSLWRKFLSLFQSAGSSRQPRPIVNIKKSVTIRTTDKDGQSHLYHSLDEVPPDLRAEFEKLESEVMKEQGGSVSLSETSPTGGVSISRTFSEKKVTVYKIKDASGNERIYHSLDELPPEIREAIQRAKKSAD